MESFGTEMMMSEQRSIALFRVCQEALANIAKYADTSEASLIFTWGDHDLKMIIEDHGKGFDYEQQGKQSSGLEAMKERMYLVGGRARYPLQSEKVRWYVYLSLLKSLIDHYSVVDLSCMIVVSASFTLSKETVRMKQDFLIFIV